MRTAANHINSNFRLLKLKLLNLNQMSKLLAYLSIVALLTMTSCDKKSGLDKVENDYAAEVKTKVDNWLQSKRTTNRSAFNSKIDLLRENLNFEDITVEGSGRRKFIAVPIRNIYQKIDKNGQQSINTLLLETNNTGEITGGVIVQAFLKDGSNKLPEKTASKIFNNEMPPGGKFVLRSMSGGFRSQLEFDQNKLASIGVMKGKGQAVNARSGDCIDWYLVTTYFFPDGSSHTTEQYITTTCDGCYSDPWAETECLPGDEGGTGDGSGGEVDYLVTSVNVFSAPEATGSFESEYTHAGIVKRNAAYVWQCGTGYGYVFRNVYNWVYKSYESGVLYKESAPGSLWLFESLTHDNIQRIGITPPGYTYTEQLGYAVTNIATNKRTATVNLEFVVYEQILAIGQTKSWTIPGSTVCKAP